ncbi:MAG: ABC transporter ATP-binding protein [Acetobacteraceae bacterium]|nr:ABC transporter ATP-binding protein [Acetobacteraceae bacterium]
MALRRLIHVFENLIAPTGPAPLEAPPEGTIRFFWYFARQARGVLAALLIAGLFTAGFDLLIPVCIGRIAGLVAHHERATLLRDEGWQLLAMGGLILFARPAALLSEFLITNQAINPSFANRVRWQSHYHVIRQSWTYFQNDFAGRIANRVIQTGPALRDVLVVGVDAVWYIVLYGGSAIVLLGAVDWRLAVPIAGWFALYAALLRVSVPRLRARSRANSEARSLLTGRVVDSYTNILTVKLFARAEDEDDFVREALESHTVAFRAQTRAITAMTGGLALINAALLAGTAAVAIGLWLQGEIEVAVVATALPLVFQITNMAGWVARSITGIFENLGQVQDGMRSIAVPQQMPDAPGARPLRLTGGAIRFEHLRFGYGTERGVLHGIDLDLQPGERIGLVGRSGSGKSTLVNLLLGFYRPDAGRILIDGQDIAGVTQESLRAQIAMVTQDTSLLHRSIRDNIRYGRPGASDAAVEEAARRAEAHGFILELEDWKGRTGYDAEVGERGVKLSGGQRQRIAIARVILKNAPILVLDEATSALDSEVEAAIQGQLDTLMEGRTVIAIAHRLSTIAQMDRLVLLEAGRIIEQGTHRALLARGGAYARAWERQSGGFIAG